MYYFRNDMKILQLEYDIYWLYVLIFPAYFTKAYFFNNKQGSCSFNSVSFRVLFIGFCQLLQKRGCKVAILLFFLAKPGYIDYSHRCNDQLY